MLNVHPLDIKQAFVSVCKELFSLNMVTCNLRKLIYECTVKPPVSGHQQYQKKSLLKRVVRSWEVKNVVFVVVRNMVKCPLTRGVCLQKVSVSGGSTLLLLISSM